MGRTKEPKKINKREEKLKKMEVDEEDISKIKRGENVQSGEQLLRMNYLYQASLKINKIWPNLSRFYLNELRKIGKKNVIRM